jgi:hypothetical protein
MANFLVKKSGVVESMSEKNTIYSVGNYDSSYIGNGFNTSFDDECDSDFGGDCECGGSNCDGGGD